MSAPTVIPLERIAESVDYGVTASAAWENVGPRFLRITDIQDGRVDWEQVPWCECSERELANACLEPGDIVFARTGATTGKSYLIRECPEATVFASYLIRVRLSEKAYAPFVSHYFQTAEYWAQISSNVRGVAQPGVNATTLKSLRIPLPPLENQRRIAAILDQAETLRTQRRQALAHLDSLTQSIFLDMFGDPVRNSKGWKKLPFCEACETRLGKMLDARQQTGQDKRRYLRNANVQWFRIDLFDLLEMDFDLAARETFKLEKGDLLICEGGEPGRAAVWRGELEDVYYQKALHRGRPKAGIASADYLVWLLWFLAHTGGLGDHVTAATIAHLTGEKLKAMPIPLPPLALQQTFATRIQAIEALKATHRVALTELNALFASLQQRAFAGTL